MICYPEEPMISIEGPEKVLYGTTAKFNAFMNPKNLKGWSLKWQKLVGLTHVPINLSEDKYTGTTDEMLSIQSVCKEDEGGYQAILSKAQFLVVSNIIFLRATGGILATTLFVYQYDMMKCKLQMVYHK